MFATTELHSLSPKWIKSGKVFPYIRPFSEPEVLDVTNDLGRRLAFRRGLVFRGGAWIRKANQKLRRDHFITARKCSVSDADLPDWMIDMLWSIYEQADDNGTLTLTEDQRHDIREMLRMVDVLDEGCAVCKGRGWGTKPDIREDGSHHGWIVQKCYACGGHGKLMYKRDVRGDAWAMPESEG